MNIKPGSVNQRPLYGCKGCYEDYSWPAGDLRVHEGECWCDLCWGERRWDFPDLPYWDDLEPYTPAEQQPAPDVSALVEALEKVIKAAPSRGPLWHGSEQIVEARAALATHRKQGGEAWRVL